MPGKPDESEILKRVTSDDEDARMPPADTGKRLTAQQVDLLRAWIAAGATWQDHWSYTPIARPAVPSTSGSAPQNAIDAFLDARAVEAGLPPAGEADRVTLARRLSFDLVGLPPAPEQVEAFVRDASPDAYERLVDELAGFAPLWRADGDVLARPGALRRHDRQSTAITIATWRRIATM